MDLERIYDLDTSRFEEEFNHLSSSKKRILVQMSQNEEEEKPIKVSERPSNQQKYILDHNKFNISMQDGEFDT